MKLGKQLTKRILRTGEVKKAFAYYGKNMMNGLGQPIYSELGKALAKSGIVSACVNVSNAIYERFSQKI